MNTSSRDEAYAILASDVASLTAERDSLKAEVARLKRALKRIAEPIQCGCKPCTDACRSPVALEAELEGRQDIARNALDLEEPR